MRFSRDQLSAMSLNQLRNIDIKDRDEELQVQEIIDLKTANLPPVDTNVYRGDVPDIKTVEQEKEWQEIINKREEEAKIPPVLPTIDEKIAEAEKVLGDVQEEIKEETKEVDIEPTDKKVKKTKKVKK